MYCYITLIPPKQKAIRVLGPRDLTPNFFSWSLFLIFYTYPQLSLDIPKITATIIYCS